jgi:hypothetical protein
LTRIIGEQGDIAIEYAARGKTLELRPGPRHWA